MTFSRVFLVPVAYSCPLRDSVCAASSDIVSIAVESTQKGRSWVFSVVTSAMNPRKLLPSYKKHHYIADAKIFSVDYDIAPVMVP